MGDVQFDDWVEDNASMIADFFALQILASLTGTSGHAMLLMWSGLTLDSLFLLCSQSEAFRIAGLLQMMLGADIPLLIRLWLSMTVIGQVLQMALQCHPHPHLARDPVIKCCRPGTSSA